MTLPTMPAASEPTRPQTLSSLRGLTFSRQDSPIGHRNLTSVCIVTITIIAFVVWPNHVLGQPTSEAIAGLDLNRPPTQFLSGRKIDVGNRAAVSVNWTGISLRTRVTQFSRARKVPIFLDRRVDSQANGPFSIADASAEQVIWKLAEANQISACRVGNWYYLGPQSVAAGLPQLIEELKQDSRRNRTAFQVNWSQTSALKTDAIFEPKKWLSQLAKNEGFEITNPDDLPHDLWLGIDMPPMSLDEKVQLILVGFGLTFERNKTGQQITLVPWQPREEIKREIEIPSGIPSSRYAPLVQQIKQGLEKVTVKRKGKKLQLSGAAKAVLTAEYRVIALQTVTGGAERAPGDSGNGKTQEVFTLSTTAARGSILVSVAKQTSRELVYAPELRGILQTAVTVSLEDATVAQIVEATLKGSSLTATIDQTQIQIKPKE